MASARTLVPFLVTFFILLNITPSFSQDTQQLIEHICRQMEEFGFCSQTFQENLKAPNADIVALTQITIERATDNATQTHDFIRQLLDKPATDPGLKNALDACENAYRLLMESFDAAALSFFQKDYHSVERSESAAPRAEASCEDSLSSAANKENLLTERNREMRILIGMALVSVDELVGVRAQKTN